MTDFRSLCAELEGCIQDLLDQGAAPSNRVISATAQARAALADSEPDVPTGKELRETYIEGYYACESRQGPDAQEAGLRAVLERWGKGWASSCGSRA